MTKGDNMSNRNLTNEEAQVIATLSDAWNKFLDLPLVGQDDTAEFRHGIHALQEKVMSRPIRISKENQPPTTN